MKEFLDRKEQEHNYVKEELEQERDQVNEGYDQLYQ